MAIVQVSRITNRKGLQENLPQLAGAELGWAIDSRRLFIGNGTLQEGAPIIGNTEILTEFSDIVALSSYTYQDIAVGYAAQTGPSVSQPVVRTVQEKLDDFANIRDFGATGDGVTDDTEAINRALYQLYCVETNTQVRRSLYFPAGTYRIIESLVIPSYAKLIGEGADCTIIYLDTTADISTLSAYVARYGDSLQQTGINIGNNSATPPRNIEISSMTFQSVEVTDIFLVEDATQCYFDSVNFVGPLTQNDIVLNTSTDDIAGLRFASTASLVCNQITIDKCGFSGLTYGISTDQEIKAVTVSNSKFQTLYQGITLGTGAPVNGGPTGFRAVHNMFDLIFAEGIIYEDVDLNLSAYNVFYDVANEYSGSPTAAVVLFGNDNNVSVSDMFSRVDSDAVTQPRVKINGGVVDTGTQIQLGRYSRASGKTVVIGNNQSSQPVAVVSTNFTHAFRMDYTIERDTNFRHGTMFVATDTSATLTFNDNFTENSSTGVTLSVSQVGSDVTVEYSSTNTGLTGILTYSLAHLA